MCLPALPVIAAIGSAAVGYFAADDAADQQNAYYDANRKAAISAAGDRYAALNNKTLQERASASQELFEKQIDALRTRATATVAAGEAGVTGLSVDALQQDLLAQQGRQMQAIQHNFEIKRQSNEDEAIATYHNTVGRINSVRQASKPSPIPFILQGIGGAAKEWPRG
jgi:hypothetical protein